MNDELLKQIQKLTNVSKGASLNDLQELAQTFISVTKELKTYLEDKFSADINGAKSESNNLFEKLNYAISESELKMKGIVNQFESVSFAKIRELSQRLTTEISVLRETMPTMPDLSVYEGKLARIEASIPVIPILSSQEIRNKLEFLSGDERLDMKAIRGLSEKLSTLDKLPSYDKAPMMHPVAFSNLPDVNVLGVTVDQTIVWNGINWVAGNAGNFQAPLTGGLTGTNTWASAPKILFIDGVPRQRIQTDGTEMWTGTTTTVLTNAPLPTFDIMGI